MFPGNCVDSITNKKRKEPTTNIIHKPEPTHFPRGDNTPSMIPDAYEIYTEFVRIFFTGANLQRFLIYTCNACPTENNDPITNTIVSILASPIHISFSEIGVRAFKQTTIATLPYYLLNEEQCNFVRYVIQHIIDGMPCSVMSGSVGGFMLKLTPPHQQIMVDKKKISEALVHAIQGVSGYGDVEMKERVISILFQRITALAAMPPPPRLR